MKKFIYSLFVLAIAAMTFSGCEDVPAPYNLPQEIIDGGDGETTADPMGTGTETDPYNVAAANQVATPLTASLTMERPTTSSWCIAVTALAARSLPA